LSNIDLERGATTKIKINEIDNANSLSFMEKVYL
jgi:hypothetical protein